MVHDTMTCVFQWSSKVFKGVKAIIGTGNDPYDPTETCTPLLVAQAELAGRAGLEEEEGRLNVSEDHRGSCFKDDEKHGKT